MPLLTRSLSLPLRLLTTLLCLYVLGVSAYHIHQRRPSISGELYAVTIISGLAAIWALLSSLLVCFAKRPGLLLPMVLLDLLFLGGFIAISVLLRGAARSKCSRFTGRDSRVCRVDKAAFSVSVANAVFFLLLALLTYRLYRAYKRNRAFGPGPENRYSTTPAPATQRKRGSKRWAHRTSEDTAMTEAAGGTGGFTRPTRGHRDPVPVEGGYREPGNRGSFDPELAHHHQQDGVRSYQAF